MLLRLITYVAFGGLFMQTVVLQPTTAFAQRKVEVTQTFVPSFSIQPLVHQLKGRAGQIIPFGFEIVANNRDADIGVGLVELRQELSGQILHGPAVLESTAVRLLNPGRSTIEHDSPHRIEGVVKVPTGVASHYTFGVLVRDFGSDQKAPNKVDPNGEPLTHAKINFVTQYVLRIDLEVAGSRGENASQLVIEDGRLLVANGLPGVRTTVRNPTDATFEFEMQTVFRRRSHPRGSSPVRMSAPVRQGLETEERFKARILPHSMIYMQGIVSDVVVTGKYDMEARLLVGGREAVSEKFQIAANADDFPAQAATIASVGGGLTATPARIELSQLRGGQRRVSVEIQNSSDQTRAVHLSALNERGTPILGMTLQPAEFSISPGRTRRFSVSLRRTDEFLGPLEYGRIGVSSHTSTQDFTESGSLPVVAQYAASEPAKLRMAAIRWVTSETSGAFRARVHNDGPKHIGLVAHLTIASEAGQRFTVQAGYGRWIMPGQETDLEFPLPRVPEPGKYIVTAELQTGGKPIVLQQSFTITDVP